MPRGRRSIRRAVSARVSPDGVARARAFLALRFPALANAPLVAAEVCQYESTPDDHFIVDRHPAAPNVWIVGGGSGHGYKMGPAIGEMIASLVLDERGAKPAVQPGAPRRDTAWGLATRDGREWRLAMFVSARAPHRAGRRSRPDEPPRDIAFRVQMVDPGFSESVAVADFNRDGRLDILSAEYWYEAPAWTKHKIRDIPFNGSYIDNFSDLPLDVDGDGYTDVVQIAYFARRIVWLKNPGKGPGPWIENEIDAVGPTEFAFLVDLNNDGKAQEVLPQFTGGAKSPLTWYEVRERQVGQARRQLAELRARHRRG